MNNAGELVRLIKKAAVEAVEADKPTAFCFGKVICTEPLKISVDQRLVLGEKQLILTKTVTDHFVDALVGFYTEEQTETKSEAEPKTKLETDTGENHRHSCKGRKKMFLLKGLKEGEEVILIRIEGGQRYIVLDRIYNCIAEGEWIE